MRSYSLGAILLDKNDPSKVIGHLNEPLLIPNEEEREGYVPNVVYSCGSIIHNNELIRLIYADKGMAKADQFWNAYIQTHGKVYEEVFEHPPNKPTEKQVNNWLEDQGKHPVERIPGVKTKKGGKKLPGYFF